MFYHVLHKVDKSTVKNGEIHAVQSTFSEYQLSTDSVSDSVEFTVAEIQACLNYWSTQLFFQGLLCIYFPFDEKCMSKYERNRRKNVFQKLNISLAYMLHIRLASKEEIPCTLKEVHDRHSSFRIDFYTANCAFPRIKTVGVEKMMTNNGWMQIPKPFGCAAGS